MILRADRFDEKVSPYERPNFPYRCGRAAAWGKPCFHGPNVNGSCGGVTECQPYNENGRWVCRRPAAAGGPCTEGPLPEGGCSHTHPACQPRRSLRKIRGRLSLMAAAIVIAAIAAFGFSFGGGEQLASSLDPGTLTSVHQNFSAETGCGTCHVAHGSGPAGWFSATGNVTGPSGKCTDCHQFKGQANIAHNTVASQNVRAIGTKCTMCHTEHKGVDAKITTITDAQCHTCHKKKFTAFAGNHPEFTETYPFRRRTAIAFNHTNHFTKHFKDQRYSEKVPATGCLSCHDIEKAARTVPIKGFEKTCAACHQDNISSRPMVLFTFPELEENPFDLQDLLEKRGLFAEDREAAMERVQEVTKRLAGSSGPVLTGSAAELRVTPMLGVKAGKKSAVQALADQLLDRVSRLAGAAKSDEVREAIAEIRTPVKLVAEEATKALATLDEKRLELLNEHLESVGEAIEEIKEDIGDGPNEELVTEIADTIEHMSERLEDLEEDEEYEPASSETLAPIAAAILGIDGEEHDEYKEPVADLVNALLGEGVSALTEVIEKAGGNPDLMLHGLSSELASTAAAAWAGNREYEPLTDSAKKGWSASEFSLIYRAPAHADPVMKAWLTFAAAKGNDSMRAELLSRTEGAGACAKCHSVSQIGTSTDGQGETTAQMKVEWPPFEHAPRPFVKYLHKPHINLLGPGSWCTTCHKINEKAEFDAAYNQFDPLVFASNFKSVGKSTCVECHGGGQVSQTCQLCHTYHQDPGFKKAMLSRVAKNR